MKSMIALAAGLFAAGTLPSVGQSLTWNLSGNGGYGSLGNSLSFTEGGVTVKATAWGYTKTDSDNAFEAARLNQYSPTGLGVSNKHEDSSSPGHQADNEFRNDWVLFAFNSLVDVESIRVQPSPGPYDRDVTYWVGNVSSNLNLDGVTYNGLAALGFFPEQHVAGTSGSSAVDVSINSPSGGVNAILFGPKRGVATGHEVDAFKITKISATVVPEPSVALLGVLGMAGLVVRRRR